MTTVLDQIENGNVDLGSTGNYAAILGESPSKGAKSPSLWNAAFQGLGLSGIMHPMDVQPAKLQAVVQALRADRRFIGGAVTMPYKIDIIPFLDDLDAEARTIGAVNCLYRRGADLIGANTDGAGALWSLERAYRQPLAGKQALVIGAGGAGFAVAAYLAGALGPSGRITLANRSPEPLHNLAEKLKTDCQVQTSGLPLPDDQLSSLDIVVNCSSLGFENLKKDAAGTYTLKFYSPLGRLDNALRVADAPTAEKDYARAAKDTIGRNHGETVHALAAMADPFVFDIVYQPHRTPLLFWAETFGYRTLNGVPMNLEQAVIAFDRATAAVNLRPSHRNEVRPLMEKVW
jgi:shikimate dehydrogenase